MIPTCEVFVPSRAVLCGARALWLVAVGSRKTDAQYSCGIHLSRTCGLMLKAEDRGSAVLTVALVQ